MDTASRGTVGFHFSMRSSIAFHDSLSTTVLSVDVARGPDTVVTGTVDTDTVDDSSPATLAISVSECRGNHA